MAIGTLSGFFQTSFRMGASNPPVGSTGVGAITNNSTITKQQAFGTAAANAAAGGADEAFSFQQAVVAGSSATLDFNAMTNLLAQTSVALARLKGVQFRVLSGSDDPSISPVPTASSVGVVTNIGVPTPSPMFFGNNGSGLTVALTAGAGAVTAVAIGAAGTGYPPSSVFMACPVQAGGSGNAFAVVTNGSGVPTSVVFVTGAGGAGYSSATVPTVVAGQLPITTGGTHTYFDSSAAGFCLVSATQKKLLFLNTDPTHAITFEIDAVGGTT